MKHKIFAHRGSSGQYAENTRAAFLQAIADGADGIECDIHLTKDLKLVCFHDFTLERTSTGTGHVADHTLEELLSLDVSSWRGAAIPPEYGGTADQLVTVDDLLQIMRGAGRPLDLAIELKHPSPYGQQLEDELLEYLLAEGWDPETSTLDGIRISLMSFHPGAIEHLGELVPADHLCQLLDDVTSDEIRDSLFLGSLTAGAVATLIRRALSEGERLVEHERAGMAGPGVDYIRSHRPLVERWLARGVRLRAWTVDSPADVELCRELGIQEITTNWPAQVRRQLEHGPAAAQELPHGAVRLHTDTPAPPL
ncbi:glycerophosphodiester phosphodiesterase [Arthrobacter mobilis]|uniref:Glycerophosphodiester phosphodiesterase n=1 Tax=Arthrobacter mobilis TaxID=2724944 RepID=A0A7X6HF30_9MICC|nr:glycerophosphodiester phosphodiesterase family protein [Arthrobacter mobilis]NKX55049.1 glycerophosphodiester phosphodiesterase [Arthrobacter mobilis]